MKNNRLVNTKVMHNVPIQMRDGVTLYCDVIRPDNDEPLPVILARTAYLKEEMYATGQTNWLVSAFKAAARGYNFVVQDARGTGWSEGVVTPIGHQDEDGYDTVEALAQMPWSNGEVGMVGESFLGWCCLEAAKLNPPHLKAIVPCEAGWRKNPYMLRYGVSTPVQYGWTYGRAMDRDAYFHDLSEETKAAIADMSARGKQLMLNLPLSDLPMNNVEGVPGLDAYRIMLEHLEDSEYYAYLGREDAHERINVPVLHITGWLDHELDTTLHNYFMFREKGNEVTKNVRLIVGPWRHGGDLTGTVDGVSFGPQGSGIGYGVDEMILDWFDHWLYGKDNAFMAGDPVHVFTMGSNEWHTMEAYPPACAEDSVWYLHSGGCANSRIGDGRLDRTAPGEEPRDHYLYDPGNPIWSMAYSGYKRFDDQSESESRSDMLVYSTKPLDEDLTVCGPVHVRLFAATDGVDTDFASRLLLVTPEGKAMEVCANLVRARYRNGKTPEFLTPGEAYEYDIDVGNIAVKVPAGWALRIEVMSSLFPVADRNTNMGGRIGFETEYRMAVQTILHDSEHPSRLILKTIG